MSRTAQVSLFEKTTVKKEISLRDYQQECVDILNSLEGGSHLVAVATGLGKTVIFSHLRRQGRVLILSHRDELVHQPEKYFDCSYGIEKAKEHSDGEEVVSASVQSIVRRLDHFAPDDFDMIITDEAHHAAAPTYKKIYRYFKPRIHIGFTATPNRGDKVRLDDVFDDIIFERNLKWGIDNGYLTNINCLQADIGFDVSKVKKKMGDFELKALADAVNQERMNKGVAQAYRELAVGQTLIFAADLAHAYGIAAEIPEAVVVTASTENRAEIIEKFTRREIPCIINCMVFTEGTDMPLIETIIIARPTTNESLYTQMVGRGLRLYEGKKFLTLIDCVGVTGTNKICTAPSLLGIDMSQLTEEQREELSGVMLTEIPNEIEKLLDTPHAWIINSKEVDVFAEENDLDMHDVNWKKNYDGSFMVVIKGKERIVLSPVDELGNTDVIYVPYDPSVITQPAPRTFAKDIPIQEAFDRTYSYLERKHKEKRQLWDNKFVSKWGKQPASDKQKDLIKRLLSNKKNREKYHCEDFNPSGLTKYEASIIIDRLVIN